MAEKCTHYEYLCKANFSSESTDKRALYHDQLYISIARKLWLKALFRPANETGHFSNFCWKFSQLDTLILSYINNEYNMTKDHIPMLIQLKKLTSQKMISHIPLSVLLCFLFVLPVSSVSANMVLSEAIIHFEPGKPLRKDIEVENPSSENLYVEITPAVVSEPGTKSEKRITITDPRESGLLVTPNKIVVPPGGRKLVRLVSLEPLGEKERVYRVTFKPVVGDLETEQIGIKVLIGYEVLILMQPAAPDPNLIVNRSGKTLSFENKGNTNILLREGKQCPDGVSNDSESCERLGGKRLYPGNSWSVDLPYNKAVDYQMSIGTKNSVKTYK